MKVLVTVKRVIDPYVKVRVKSDGSASRPQTSDGDNPFCEIASSRRTHEEAGVVTEIARRVDWRPAVSGDAADGDGHGPPTRHSGRDAAKCSRWRCEAGSGDHHKEQPKLVIMGKAGHR